MLNSANAAIIAGDVIGVNFVAGAHSEANWNNLTTGTLSIPTGSVVRLEGTGGAGSVVTGVSMTVGAGNGFADDGASEGWTTSGGGNPVGDPYGYYTDTEALNDIQHQGNTDLTISGLDAGLTYNVIIYSFISNNGGTTDSFGVNGGTLVPSTRGERWASDSPVVFSGESAPGGALVVNSNTAGVANVFWNAVVVEAVPEPSTLALTAVGLLGLRRRRRR